MVTTMLRDPQYMITTIQTIWTTPVMGNIMTIIHETLDEMSAARLPLASSVVSQSGPFRPDLKPWDR
ncbi:MAG: hypothetical protein BGP07_00185 [Rhizobiales bacterium 63-22]|nr:MAG: hypothetical protein BGP07_00185 [Rhizobiales bacterium 63-22]